MNLQKGVLIWKVYTRMHRGWQLVGSGDEKEGREGDDGTGSFMGWLEGEVSEGMQNGVHGEECRMKEERLHST